MNYLANNINFMVNLRIAESESHQVATKEYQLQLLIKNQSFNSITSWQRTNNELKKINVHNHTVPEAITEQRINCTSNSTSKS